MYSELLVALYDGVDQDELPTFQDELVNVLRQCRNRLLTGSPGDVHTVADNLVLELDHDRTLLWLCAAMAIEHDPARFTDRAAERRHLEQALRLRGIDLDASKASYGFHSESS
jgi:hypothetical protein